MGKEKNLNDYVYISVILTIFILIALYIIYILVGSPNIFTCKIYEKYGVYCPGCGCTRALISVFQGNIIESLKYNPTVLYAIITTLIYVGTNTFGRLLGKDDAKFVMKYKPVYLYLGIAILVITCIIKNL